MILPPFSLTTPRLILRCWKPADAPLMKAAIDANLDHLRPWMPWAHDEPSTLPTVVERVEKFARNFREGRDFVYGIFHRDTGEILGGTGLHPRNGPTDREIGYWLTEAATGQGFVSESCAALTSTAFAVWPELRTVTIVCNPANVRSAAVPARLGFSLLGNFPAKEPRPDREFDQIWRTTRGAWTAEWAALSAAAVPA